MITIDHNEYIYNLIFQMMGFLIVTSDCIPSKSTQRVGFYIKFHDTKSLNVLNNAI